MKLFIITALKEHSEVVATIFKQSGITVFSATDIVGYKGDNLHPLLDNWFGAGDARFDSVMLFSFTGEANAEKALTQIQLYNSEQGCEFPLRAFIVPIEKFSH